MPKILYVGLLIITTCIVVWPILVWLIARSADRKRRLNEVEGRLLRAERRLDQLERQFKRGGYGVAPPVGELVAESASMPSEPTPPFGRPGVLQSTAPNLAAPVLETPIELVSRIGVTSEEPPLLRKPAPELTDSFKSKGLIVTDPPRRAPGPASGPEKRWRRFEEMFSENWTGILGSVVVVAGVTFIGIYTGLRLAPFYRFLMIVGAAAALGGSSVLLRRREAWQPLAQWVRSAAAAIFLFACAASGRLPGLGLVWIEAATPALALLVLGMGVNLYLSWAAGAQTFASLHVILSVLPMLIMPQSAMSLGITSFVALFGVILSFRARWDQHLLIVIGTYVVYHVAWYLRMGPELDGAMLRSFGVLSAVTVFSTTVLAHYRKDYASQNLDAWPLLVHISNWALLALSLLVYLTMSSSRSLALALVGVIAYLLARRARPLGIGWLYLCDTFVGQAFVVASLVSLYPLIADIRLMLLAIFLESILFLRLIIDEGEDKLVKIGWFLANIAGLLFAVSGSHDALGANAAMRNQNALIMLIGAAVMTIIHLYLTRNHGERLRAYEESPFPAAAMGWQIGAMLILALLNLAGSARMETTALLAAGGLLLISRAMPAPGLMAGGGAAVIATHLISWWILFSRMPWEVAPLAQHIGPLSVLAALTISLAGLSALRQIAIYLLGIDVGLAVYLFFNPVSSLIPGVVWLALSLLALELANRLKRPSAISVLLLGYGYIAAFVGAYALVIIQSPAHLGVIRARMLIEIFGLGVVLYWLVYSPRQTLAEHITWRRVHPFFLELGLIALAVINIVEVPTQWRPFAWSLLALALLPPVVRRIDERLRLYSVIAYWVSVAHVAVIMSVFESPSARWYDRSEIMSLIALLPQIGYIIASHRHLLLADVRYPQGLGALGNLSKLINARRNVWVYYPFFTGVALFLFWRFDRSVLTLLWAAEAFVVFVLGAVLRENQFRHVAMSALAVCLARLLVIDLAETNLGLRGAVFVGVGLLMLGMNAIYNRYRVRFQ